LIDDKEKLIELSKNGWKVELVITGGKINWTF
jgi:hypothetical protein